MYEGVSRIFRTGRPERELQMVQFSATRRSCVAISWVILVSFGAITLFVASQRLFVVVAYFVIDSVRKLLDTPSYTCKACQSNVNTFSAINNLNTPFFSWGSPDRCLLGITPSLTLPTAVALQWTLLDVYVYVRSISSSSNSFWTVEARFLAGAGIFFIRHCVHTGSGAHPSSCQMRTGALSAWVERPGRESDHHHIMPMLKIPGPIAIAPPYVFMAWYLVKRSNNFTFTTF
jgi:hypothetical protein